MSENLDWQERFRNIYKPLLGDGYDEFEYALRAEKARHIRLNMSRSVDYLSELNIFCGEELAGFKGVYKIVAGDEKLTDTVSFQTGGAYIMNPSSVIPPSILASFMPHEPLILDVSAAPGGKTCALSDLLGRRGLIVANEVSPSRLKSLHFNLEKYGCYNVKTISRDGRLINRTFENSFDGVLLDAPCSNENKIFRNKTVQKSWNKALVERMAALQRQLILSSYDSLKEGGVLVYSTCTLSVEENENVTQFLLDKRASADLLKIDEFSGGGFSGVSAIDEKIIRITPSNQVMDGFFIAVFRKGEKGGAENKTYKSRLSEKQIRFFKDNFGRVPESVNITESEGRGYIEPAGDHFPHVRFARRGLNIYRLAKENLEPTCQSVWEFGCSCPENVRSAVDYLAALEYLKGFDIVKPRKYNTGLLFSGNIPLGYGKVLQDVIKNKLDRYFLFGKNIEW